MPDQPPIKNRTALATNYAKAYAEMPPGGWSSFMMGLLDSSSIEVLARNSIPLRDFIDVELLVNRHVLRQEGIDPEAIRIVMGNIHTSFALPEFHLLVVDGDDLRLSAKNHEHLYVMIAHELAHFKQTLGDAVDRDVFRQSNKRNKLHADRPHEQEAFFWEAQQATKFGWSREDYERYLQDIYPETLIRHDPEAAIEKRLRAAAAMPVLSRRPVTVRQYRRRR